MTEDEINAIRIAASAAFVGIRRILLGRGILVPLSSRGLAELDHWLLAVMPPASGCDGWIENTYTAVS
jgi:hypothetical protein